MHLKVGVVMDISKIDKNFAIETKIEREGLKFYDIDEAPFKICGVFREGDHYVRLPAEVAQSVSEGVFNLHTHMAGGRVRFVTDSPYVAISIKLNNAYKMSHFAFTGSVGCDMFSGRRFIGTVVPPTSARTEYEGVINVPFTDAREYTINMPLYSGIDKMYVGIKEGSILKAAPDYELATPIVFYGSSITQGGCASRPGNAYQNIISRELDCDFVNLGFSGNAKAEDEIANYIAGLDMSVFVYDYGFNAPTLEHYQNTHERMFKIIRNANPNLPILMISKPKCYETPDTRKWVDVMMETYNNAKASGDENVYYIDGHTLFPESMRESAVVDGTHPTDVGFWCMAKAIGDKLREILKIEG